MHHHSSTITHLLHLTLLSTNAAALAQLNPSPTACPLGIAQTAPTPGANSIYYDNDPNLLYTNARSTNCTSTSQKLIHPGWASGACANAMTSVCSATNATETWQLGTWSWAWNTRDGGGACQVGVYQPKAGVGSGVLDPECCMFNLQAASYGFEGQGEERWNRASVNVRRGGFPYTKGEGVGGVAVDVFEAVDERVPSFIIQGIPPPYPYTSEHCTEADIKGR